MALVNKLVRVQWLDTMALSGWKSRETVCEHKPSVVNSFGILLEDTEEKLTIAGSYDDQGHVSDVNVIPKKCVVSIVQVRLRGDGDRRKVKEGVN